MKAFETEEIIEQIKSLMIVDTDINSQILSSNHLLEKQIDYKLETTYKRPIELKSFSSPKIELSFSEFLIYSRERMNYDYVDILFGKYIQLNREEFKNRLTENSRSDLGDILNSITMQSTILTVDETRLCQTFLIETANSYHFILENWPV